MNQALDKSQLGRAGELALEFYALVEAGDALDIYTPVVDDDHVDLIAAHRGGAPALAIQVKTTDHLDANGLVEARASYPHGSIREDPNFLYAVVLLDSVRIASAWLIPSADFNRSAYHVSEGGREVLELRASPTRRDAFARFRVEPLLLGKAIAERIAGAAAGPEWIISLGRRDR